MSTTELQLTEEKYLFTFQDETQLWISRGFIEKYLRLPFHDIIQHSDKYDDGSYYIDIPSLNMKKVIQFLLKENVDISILDLKDSYDIYKTLLEYSVVIDNEKQGDLLFHVKELFIKYMKENNYYISKCNNENKISIPVELFNSKSKIMIIYKEYYIYSIIYKGYHIYIGLLTPQRKDEFLYYSLLFKMMNVTKINIECIYILYTINNNIDQYSSSIPLEYICPSCIKDIFPLLKEIKIIVVTHYKKTDQFLNPNSDEYIMEYSRLFGKYYYKINNPEQYEYYTESNMNEYNKVSSLDMNHLYYSHKLIDSYNGKKRKIEFPKLYKYIVNECIYTNDYSDISETEGECIFKDEVSIEYDDKTNDKTFFITKVLSEQGIFQLLSLFSYYSISKIGINPYSCLTYESIIILKALEEGVFNSLTILSIHWIIYLTKEIDYNQFIKIMTTHVFPNVTELIYDDSRYIQLFQLSLIKQEYFPKLHFINYTIDIEINNFEFLFPDNLLSMIDTIRIYEIEDTQKEKIVLLLDTLTYNHSIHIDVVDKLIYDFPHLKELLKKDLISVNTLCIDTSNIVNIKKLDYFENYKRNINCLDITFKFPDEYDTNTKYSLERFFKSNILHHLNKLTVTFIRDINIEYLTWISTLFNDNTFHTIQKLTINLRIKDLSSEYLTGYENIMMKLIPKASIDILGDRFCELYTTTNFPQLQYIKLDKRCYRERTVSFIQKLFEKINNNNFPKSTIIQIINTMVSNNNYYIYNPNTSILRYKYDTNSCIDTLVGTKYQLINKFEIETLLDCINENKTQKIKSLKIYIYSQEQLSKFIGFITTGRVPQLKYFDCNICEGISYEQIDIYKQQLKDSSFIQENHVNYKLENILE
ncbi:hypothetical protein WA158_005979 [Blastocystis sp. Blastoise]